MKTKKILRGLDHWECKASALFMPKFHRDRRQCQQLLLGQEAGNSVQITRLMTSSTVALCSNVSPWHRALAAWWGCWQELALCSALVGRVWRLCFWRVPAPDFLLLVLAETGDWIHREWGQGRNEMAYTMWQARRLVHRAHQKLFTISRIIWGEISEGLSMQNYFLAYKCDLELHRDIWPSRWFFFTFVS